MPRQSNISSQRADAGGRVASGLVRVSAGELLGRTHEELVLLLIQLRRQNATVLKAMETCHMEIEAQVRRERKREKACRRDIFTVIRRKSTDGARYARNLDDADTLLEQMRFHEVSFRIRCV